MMMTEHARIFGLRQRLVCATDSAMDSLFSMYDRELLNEFDLMLLNENELSNNQDIEEVVSKYLTMNANPKQDHLLLSGNLYRGTSSTAEIENTVSVIENEGELFARSVLEFMKYRTLGIAVEKVQEQLEELEMGDDAKTMAKEQQELEQESFDEQFLEKTNEEKKKYTYDSTGKGNYSGTNGNQPIATGSIETYAVNNIYDMAENVRDCAIEA